jgi:hypothetical protein
MLPACVNPNEQPAPGAPRRRFHKLRIAWSVVCGIACVLLVVLCIRSYMVIDAGELGFSNTWCGAAKSDSGEVLITIVHLTGATVPDHWFLAIPHWLLIIFFAIAAAFVWLRWSKRFSLRTLLIAMTLIAVVLGLIVWMR